MKYGPHEEPLLINFNQTSRSFTCQPSVLWCNCLCLSFLTFHLIPPVTGTLGLVSKATLGKLLRDSVEHICAFS